jgi:hypothetical protein
METVVTKNKTFGHPNTSNAELERFDWVGMHLPFSRRRFKLDRKDNPFGFMKGVVVESPNLSSFGGLTIQSTLNHGNSELVKGLPSLAVVCVDQNWISSFHAQANDALVSETSSCHWVDIWKNDFVKETNAFSATVSNISFLEKSMSSVGRTLLSRIKVLEEVGKKQEAIKEAHDSVHRLVAMDFIKIIDSILHQVSNSNFSLPVLIAFLASTKKLKESLKNRDLVFSKAEDIAIAEIGAEKVNNSIFRNLK